MNPLHVPAARRRPLAVLTAAIVAVFVVFVCTRVGQRFDDAAKLFGATHELSRRLRRDGLPTFKHLSTLIAAGAAFSVIVAVSLWHARRPVRALLGAVLVAAPPVLLAEALKAVLPRPALLDVPAYLRLPTFPSGHVAVVAGCALAVFLLAPPARRGVAAGLGAVVVGSQVVLVVVGARHRPSDAVAAVLLTSAWGLLGIGTAISDEPVIVSVPRRLGSAVLVSAVVAGVAALLVAPDDSVATRSVSSRCVAVSLVWALIVSVEFARVLLVHLPTVRLATDDAQRPVPTYRQRSR